ncbi:MAG: M20/M25/M40 family metallo-hydrolase [Acidimicrobiales bacterium]|nr:M20/M25/M40 family metallo-hydrolase [Acidimicrobiales bacterium]
MTSIDAARLLETFLDLARIDSPTGLEGACARYCADALSSAGCVVHFDDSSEATGSDTGNLIAILPGRVPKTLGLSAHMDCVEPCRGVEPIVTDGVIRSAGSTVLGADDKVGLAAAIEAVRCLASGGEARPTVKVIFSVQEEIGLHGAKQLSADDAACDLCLVLDAAGEPGGIVVGAPTHCTFSAEFTGKAAHAGVEPEAGISAVRMAAEAVGRMELGRLDSGTTANIGTIEGGGATNVIAARCGLTGECRSLDRERVESVRSAMDFAMRSAAAEYGGSVEITWTREYEGFTASEDDPAVTLVSAACADAGLAPRLYTTGGGSDANVFAATGVDTLALACGMSDVHSTEERLAVADMNALTELVLAVARRMAAGEGR